MSSATEQTTVEMETVWKKLIDIVFFIFLIQKKKPAWTRFLSPGIQPHPDFTHRWQHLVKVSYKLQECDRSHKRAPSEALQTSKRRNDNHDF